MYRGSPAPSIRHHSSQFLSKTKLGPTDTVLELGADGSEVEKAANSQESLGRPLIYISAILIGLAFALLMFIMGLSISTVRQVMLLSCKICANQFSASLRILNGWWLSPLLPHCIFTSVWTFWPFLFHVRIFWNQTAKRALNFYQDNIYRVLPVIWTHQGCTDKLPLSLSNRAEYRTGRKGRIRSTSYDYSNACV